MTTDRMNARALRYVLDQPFMLRLYVSLDPVSEEFTELAVAGYTPKLYTLMDWMISQQNPVLAEGTVSEFRFVGNTQRAMVLGAYMTDRNNGTYWAGAFPQPLEIGRTGDIIPVRPIYKLGSFGTR